MKHFLMVLTTVFKTQEVVVTPCPGQVDFEVGQGRRPDCLSVYSATVPTWINY